MRLAAVVVAVALLTACQKPDQGAAQRMQALEYRIALLEKAQLDRATETKREQARPPAASQGPPPSPPSPRFELDILGANVRPRTYSSAKHCEVARQAVMKQQTNECRASGAIACNPYQATCVPL